MSIVLRRIDERLIHGQVVIGWGHQLRPDCFVLVDDELADSDWEKQLYELAAGGPEVIFANVDDARDRLPEWGTSDRRVILLTRDIGTMRRLAEGGLLSGEEVNLGGIHHGPGRKELLPYLYVTQKDRESLRTIAAEGVELSARDLPDAHRVSLSTLLKD
ncbi:MAG: PTS sugar transporter subunit IIB [Longimicrobiales bacterium]|nr:PTS sugar transporter subunit IIB [Longimicrobiales bacterium]